MESDEEIAKRVQRGDIEAFAPLVERYEAKISRYGRRFLKDSQDIQDLVQDIFIKAYANIQSFDASRKFSPWIYRIAHNEFVNELKKKSGRSVINIDWDSDVFFPHPVAEEETDRESDKRILSEAMNLCLSELDPKYREPLVLFYFEDLDYKSIADVLHIPSSTVGVRIMRGKDQLKKIYTEKYGREI